MCSLVLHSTKWAYSLIEVYVICVCSPVGMSKTSDWLKRSVIRLVNLILFHNNQH